VVVGLHSRPSGRVSPGQVCLFAGVQKNQTVKSSKVASESADPVILSKPSYHSGFECLPLFKAERMGPRQICCGESVVVEEEEVAVLVVVGLHSRPSGRVSPGQLRLFAGVQKNQTVKSSKVASESAAPVILSKPSYHSGFECRPLFNAELIGPRQICCGAPVVATTVNVVDLEGPLP